MTPDMPPEKPEVSVQLVGEQAADGVPFQVGAVLTVSEGWHLYWEHPGDAGQETWADLLLPEGWTAAGPQYPGPERFDTQGVTSYGWEGGGAVVHEVVASGPGTLRARVGWLACKEICVPGQTEVALQPDTGELTPWLARLPQTTLPAQTTDGLAWTVAVPPGSVDFFPGAALDLVLTGTEQGADHLVIRTRRPPTDGWGVIGHTDPATSVTRFHRVVLETP